MRLHSFDPNEEFDTVTSELSYYVRTRDNDRCCLCAKLGSQLHHMIFRSHQGKHTSKNLALLCHTCHDNLHHGKFSNRTEVLKQLQERIAKNEKTLRERI